MDYIVKYFLTGISNNLIVNVNKGPCKTNPILNLLNALKEENKLD